MTRHVPHASPPSAQAAPIAETLAGQFLLAMPGMDDPRFRRSVIAVCAHDAGGAMGLCVHRPRDRMTVPELLRELDIDPRDLPDVPVLAGGPVEPGRGFVLHTPDWSGDDTLHVAGRWALTGTRDILTAIADGRGPRRWLMALGYAGWGGGQLESELTRNGWFTTPASEALLWETDIDLRWRTGFGVAGIDSRMLSSEAGRA